VVQRARERTVVGAYLAASAALSRISTRVSEPVARVLFLGGYYAWPAKRRIVLANASRVLGKPTDHPDVRRLARQIYATYARFALELMRLPAMHVTEPLRLVPDEGAEHQRFMAYWERLRADGRGMIAVSGHVGSIEVFAGAYAQRGIPTFALADDSAYPELFDLLNRQRARWGVTIIPWRNLREIFRVLRKPVALGLVVDWGYRPTDVPVRLFGAWTTLPAGPATLAARSRAAILPVVVRRQPDGTFRASMDNPIDVADASPRELQRATQRIADALETMVREAPEQWYTFKPMWPATQAEGEHLERRAREMAGS
jgi:KDO2-lipid IV(A) lauroyltransferase